MMRASLTPLKCILKTALRPTLSLSLSHAHTHTPTHTPYTYTHVCLLTFILFSSLYFLLFLCLTCHSISSLSLFPCLVSFPFVSILQSSFLLSKTSTGLDKSEQENEAALQVQKHWHLFLELGCIQRT